MNNLLEILSIIAGIVIDNAGMFLTSFWEAVCMPETGITVALAAGMAAYGGLTENVLATTRRWHGSIDDQFSNINNAVIRLIEHQSQWMVPSDLMMELTQNRDQLQVLINKCRTSAASADDRAQRSMLLKSTVGVCLLQLRTWAYGQFFNKMLTVEDIHELGFLLPGETGGRHDRTEETDVVAEVKVKIINEDIIRVVIDQSGGENAAQVAHGWPAGVRNALIIIMASDGKTEIYRLPTTKLHNDIRMPEGSHGKLFIIKASFMRHVNDEPRFGNEPTFSMPLTTADLAAAIDRQHHEDYEEKIREIERQRLEVERLRAELNAKK
jgi:hypothetical protein